MLPAGTIELTFSEPIIELEEDYGKGRQLAVTDRSAPSEQPNCR